MTRTLDTHIAGIPCRIQYNLFPAIRGAREGGVPMEPDVSERGEITAVIGLGRELTVDEEDQILTHIENILGDYCNAHAIFHY